MFINADLSLLIPNVLNVIKLLNSTQYKILSNIMIIHERKVYILKHFYLKGDEIKYI
jgi:hypothetical protein